MRKADSPAGLPNEASAFQAAAPFFDEGAAAWVFSRYADVMSAFRSADLAPCSLKRDPVTPADIQRLRAFRRETQKVFNPERLKSWQQQLEPEAKALAGRLSICKPTNLLVSFAQPLCTTLASMVVNICPHQASQLRLVASPVCASAAEPADLVLKKQASAASKILRSQLPEGPEPLRDSTFVALTHTLPCLLGNAWFALLQNRQQWNILHQDPALLAGGLEELLRCAALPRILFRRAMADLDIGGVRLREGDTVMLNIEAANHDPEKFAESDHADIRRRRVRPLTLGGGPHACVGAPLIRMAMIALTRPLIERFSSAKLDRPVHFEGGSGFHFPTALWVVFSES